MNRNVRIERKPGSELKRVPFPPRTEGLPRVPWDRLPASGEGLKSAARRGSGSATGNLVPAPKNSGPTPKVRALVLERDGYCCVCCGLSVIGQRYSLAHRLRASQGGKPLPSNLLTFLGLGGELHHGRIDSRRDPADEAKGYTVRSWQDPAQIPVMVFSEGGSGVSAWLWDDGRYHFDGPQAGAS